MKVSIDFDQSLSDFNGQPILGSTVDEETREKLRGLQLIANHRESPLAQAQAALKEMEELNKEHQRQDTLGDACINALMSPWNKADGGQVRRMMTLARKIQGSADPDAPHTIFEVNDKQRKMISEALERVYVKTNPYLYDLCYGLINGDEDEEEEDEE